MLPVYNVNIRVALKEGPSKEAEELPLNSVKITGFPKGVQINLELLKMRVCNSKYGGGPLDGELRKESKPTQSDFVIATYKNTSGTTFPLFYTRNSYLFDIKKRISLHFLPSTTPFNTDRNELCSFRRCGSDSRIREEEPDTVSESDPQTGTLQAAAAATASRARRSIVSHQRTSWTTKTGR